MVAVVDAGLLATVERLEGILAVLLGAVVELEVVLWPKVGTSDAPLAQPTVIVMGNQTQTTHSGSGRAGNDKILCLMTHVLWELWVANDASSHKPPNHQLLLTHPPPLPKLHT